MGIGCGSKVSHLLFLYYLLLQNERWMSLVLIDSDPKDYKVLLMKNDRSMVLQEPMMARIFDVLEAPPIFLARGV